MGKRIDRRTAGRAVRMACATVLLACVAGGRSGDAAVGMRPPADPEKAARPSAARIVGVHIDSVETPTFEAREYGRVGRYERLLGRFSGELDPADAQNAFIVNIDRAPRNARGMVEYSADFRILKPLDMARGNQTMLYDVVNRGSQRIFNLHRGFTGDYGSYPPNADRLGDGWLLEQGYTLVWSGWKGDAPPGGGRVTARVPMAKNADGSAMRRWITTEVVPDKPVRTASLAYPAAAAKMADAKLYRRATVHAPLELVARDSWLFSKCEGSATPVASAVDVCLPAGFSPTHIYSLVYEAQDPPVMGIGFAAIRDFISFLRYDTTDLNPIVARRGSAGRTPITSTIAFGQSQSGRFVRDFVYQGTNRDTAGRKVFDGVIAHTAGGRRTYTNFQFAEPGRWSRPVEDHYFLDDQFPFTYDTLTDPLTGRIDGLLQRCRASSSCPRVMQWDSAGEPWIGRGSLVTTDPLGTRDVALPDSVRFYFFAATQHQNVPDDPAPDSRWVCELRSNTNSYRETQRALLVAMQAWVAKGTLPPPSQYPKVSDGTLVPPLPQAAQGFPAIPGVRYPGKVNDLFVNDQQSLPPRHTDAEYALLVPKVDRDGNDIAGIRSAMIQVPLGTYTGWSTRKAGFIEGELCGQYGGFIPFAKTAGGRGADPRPSLEERYGTHARYVDLVRAATARLQEQRLLLPADAALLVREAARRDLGLPK